MSWIPNLGAGAMRRLGFPVLQLLLAVASTQLGAAHAQGDCGNCYHLSPGAIAGVVMGDLLLTLLIAVAVYYMATCFYKRQLSSSDLKKENESAYQELNIHNLDVYSDLKNPRSNFR